MGDEYLRLTKVSSEGDLLSARWRRLFKGEPCFQTSYYFSHPVKPFLPNRNLRSVSQMLVREVKGRPLELIALHDKEVGYYTERLDAAYERGEKCNFWLVNLSGKSQHKASTELPKDDLAFRTQLQQVRLFHGELDRIMKEDPPCPWLLELYRDQPDEVAAFLQLCVYSEFSFQKEAHDKFLKWLRAKSSRL